MGCDILRTETLTCPRVPTRDTGRKLLPAVGDGFGLGRAVHLVVVRADSSGHDATQDEQCDQVVDGLLDEILHENLL